MRSRAVSVEVIIAGLDGKTWSVSLFRLSDAGDARVGQVDGHEDPIRHRALEMALRQENARNKGGADMDPARAASVSFLVTRAGVRYRFTRLRMNSRMHAPMTADTSE